MAIQEILQGVFTVFSKNLMQTAWDETSIVMFQNGLHWQIKRLEACSGWQMEKIGTEMGSKDVLLTRLKLKSYFQGI